MPDGAVPIFQTVNLKGEATLEVEAVIKALGLTLPEGEGFIADRNRIEWKNSSGEINQNISGEFVEENHQLNLQAALSSPELNIRGGVNNDMRILHQAEKGDTIWTLVGPNSISHFLQIADGGVTGKWVCNFGTTTFQWPGGAQVVSILISHGLGVVPVMNLAITSSIVCISAIPAHTGTTITVEVNDLAGIPSAGTVTGISWFAIG